MPPASRSKSRLAAYFFFAILAVAAVCVVYALLHSGPWIVPDSAKRLPNPLAPSEANLSAAQSTYMDKCSDCHGDSGRGDGSQAKMYSTPPSDLTDTQHFSSVTDGELFYKITYGHRPMPSFRKRLSDTQRWQLVLFIRSISHSTSPPLALPSQH
jgi:mono/diheme cytochrome c family protein